MALLAFSVLFIYSMRVKPYHDLTELTCGKISFVKLWGGIGSQRLFIFAAVTGCRFDSCRVGRRADIGLVIAAFVVQSVAKSVEIPLRVWGFLSVFAFCESLQVRVPPLLQWQSRRRLNRL